MKRFVSVLMAAVMLISGLTAFAEESSDLSASPEENLIDEIASALGTRGTVVTTVITEPFYEGVSDAESAMAAMESVADRLGADESTELMLESAYETDELTYYTFRQMVGSVVVDGASAKLIADRNGTAVCAVGSLAAGLDFETAEGKVLTEEQAESIVSESGKDSKITVYKGMSHQAVVDFNGTRRLVWVVYTNNPHTELDVAFLAYYVDDQGEIIGSVPMASPFSTDEENYSIAELAFAGMKPDVWSGEVTLFDGTTRSLAVPIMTDENGTQYLGDVQRKILCVDWAAWENNKDLNIRVAENGRFDDGELLIYESIIRVWDFYAAIGWTGADGKGTPILLRMDMVDENGDPVRNAYYGGPNRGFQTFSFNRVDRDGETLDVIGHEYTHCVTTVLSVEAPYMNDCGAINESISDIMGNLMEEMLDASDDPDWLIGEAAKNPEQILRSMSDPHLYTQPEFVWDRYYYPAVHESSQGEDHGGVHVNSSLLNRIAWRLHEAGMKPEDEFHYFMNVILTMTGTVTYPEMAVLLPWCLEQVKQEKYMDALKAAIGETGIEDYLPTRFPEGCALVMADIAEDSFQLHHDLLITFAYEDKDGKMQEIYTWPDDRLGVALIALPAGSYGVTMRDLSSDESWLLTEDGWQSLNDSPDEKIPEITVLNYAEDEFYELPEIVLNEPEIREAA